MTSPVTHQWVPAQELRPRQLEALHENWNEKRADDHAAASAILNKLPVKPLSLARDKPNRGSKDNLHLVARVVANKEGAPNLLAPATSATSWMANALAPAINIGTSGISGMASSFSSVMAKGVKAATETLFEKSSEPANAVYSSAGSRPDPNVSEASRRGANERKNACRFMLPLLRAA